MSGPKSVTPPIGTLSFAESGTVQDSSGKTHNFSLSQPDLKPDENVFRLAGEQGQSEKPSVDAMLAFVGKLRTPTSIWNSCRIRVFNMPFQEGFLARGDCVGIVRAGLSLKRDSQKRHCTPPHRNLQASCRAAEASGIAQHGKKTRSSSDL